MAKVDLFKPKFTGQRFEDHTLPFEILEDLSAYQELLIQVARDVYHEQHNVKRVPNGFGNGVYLKLEKIEQGSSIPVILIAASSFLASNVDTLTYFQQAQEKIVQVISLADTNNDITTVLSPEALKCFRRIGRNLRDDEAMYFNPGQSTETSLTKVKSRQIALSSPTVDTVDSELDIRGVISAVSKDPIAFTLKTNEGDHYQVPIDGEDFNIVKEAFDKFENYQRVLVSCTGIYNKTNKLEELKDIKSVVLLDEMDVPAQLDKYVDYKNGWLDGESGVAFVKEDLKWLASEFDKHYNYLILLPYTFPTINGGIQFEWKQGEHDASLEVDLETKTAYYHYYNSQSDTFEEKDLDLNISESWKWLNDSLIKYFMASE